MESQQPPPNNPPMKPIREVEYFSADWQFFQLRGKHGADSVCLRESGSDP